MQISLKYIQFDNLRKTRHFKYYRFLFLVRGDMCNPVQQKHKLLVLVITLSWSS